MSGPARVIPVPLSRLAGLPGPQPPPIDVRTEAGAAADPRFPPGAVRRDSRTAGPRVPELAGQGTTRRPSLLDRYGAWLRRREDAARLREMDGRAARDMGVIAFRASHDAPQGFAVDPRPLWGVGLTPQPMDVSPPWAAGRRGR
jgi:hypothetical protein